MGSKICHITTVHKPFDNRIFFKECISLREAGYEVTLLCARATTQRRDGVTIIGFPGHTGRIKRFFLTSFIDVYQEAIKVNASIYHLHDPELIWMGLRLKMAGKKVIMDLHENNAAAILSRPYVKSAFLKKFLSIAINKVEGWLLPYFDAIVTARPDISALFPKLHPVTLRNFPVLPDYDSIPVSTIVKTKPSLIYVGGASVIRGTKELIAAMEYCPEAELWILGPFESETFQRECENLAGWKEVKYLGVVEATEIFSYIKAADIGIITFLPFPNHITTLATKPFEYMACGLPMIMSDFPYWRAFFGDSSLYTDPADPKAIANSIHRLLNDNELRENMREKNLRLAREEFNWQTEKKGLLKVYENLELELRKSPGAKV